MNNVRILNSAEKQIQMAANRLLRDIRNLVRLCKMQGFTPYVVIRGDIGGPGELIGLIKEGEVVLSPTTRLEVMAFLNRGSHNNALKQMDIVSLTGKGSVISDEEP